MPWGLTRFHESRSLGFPFDSAQGFGKVGISAAGSGAHQAPQLSAATIAPFDSFAALSRSGQAPVVYHGRKPANLRVRVEHPPLKLQRARF
jgi:hypothetical protein